MDQNPFRLGFFTRLVDDAPAAEVYRRAIETFVHAEGLGYEAGWVAQHHAHNEGGLPSPLILLTAAAIRTTRLQLLTGIITLPLEDPLRMAEDAAVLDVLSGGRLELGFGTGGGQAAFTIFGRNLDERHQLYSAHFDAARRALLGEPLFPGGPTLWPPAPHLVETMWEATFHVDGGVRAARHATGLLLSRTQPRPLPAPGADPGRRQPLSEIQTPIVDAYFAHWVAKRITPRIGMSRTVYVAPTHEEAIADAEVGMRRHATTAGVREGLRGDESIEELIAWSDFHIGSPDEVIAGLSGEPLLKHATDLMIQVHPVDGSHHKTLRSLELFIHRVAPALGWTRSRAVADSTPMAASGGH